MREQPASQECRSVSRCAAHRDRRDRSRARLQGMELTLMRLQQQLATLSPQGSLIVAQGSGHDVQLDRPETVIEAVRRMVVAVQARR